MKKTWYDLQELLVLGGDNVSEHISWIARTVIGDIDKANDLAMLAWQKDTPTFNGSTAWGEYYRPVDAIAINLEHHYFIALNDAQDDRNMNTSIKLMILVSLIDTLIHETCHKLGMAEEECRKVADEYAWRCSETVDVEIKSFGVIIDDLINEFHISLREDIKEPDCKEWKKIQCHMLDNDLSFFEPTRKIEVKSYRKAMEVHCMEDRNWISVTSDKYRTFHVMTPSTEPVETLVPNFTPKKQVAAPVLNNKPVVKAPPVTGGLQQGLEPPKEPLPEMKSAPKGDSTPMDYLEDNSDEFAGEMDDYNPLDDDEHMDVIDDSYVAPKPVVKQVVDKAYVHKAQQMVETVLRRMFHHVYTKCGYDKETGYYTNAGAVLDPINVADIDGLDTLFHAMDTIDAMGKFVPKQQINGQIKGCLSELGLPQYKMWFNIGGKLKRRTFICQSPNNCKPEFMDAYKGADGKINRKLLVADEHLKPWSRDARNGTRIMTLMPEAYGMKPLAHILLDDGKDLGQETFELWVNK